MTSSTKYKKDSSLLVQDLIKMKDESINYLYNSLYPLIKKYVIKNSGSVEDASDVFQDTVIAAYQNFNNGSTLSDNVDFINYLYSIARNIWHTQLRYKSRIERNLSEKFNLEDEIEVPGFDEKLQEIVFRCLSKLPPDYRDVLMLYYEGLSYIEIAKKMGYDSENQAKSIKIKAKKTLMSLILNDSGYKSLS